MTCLAWLIRKHAADRRTGFRNHGKIVVCVARIPLARLARAVNADYGRGERADGVALPGRTARTAWSLSMRRRLVSATHSGAAGSSGVAVSRCANGTWREAAITR